MSTGVLMCHAASFLTHSLAHCCVCGPVGIGGQAVWLARDRKAVCEAVLSVQSRDYECLKSLAAALVTETLPSQKRVTGAGVGVSGTDEYRSDCGALQRAVALLRCVLAI
jgi:hypothetical protein